MNPEAELPGLCPVLGLRPDVCEDLRRRNGDQCRNDADCPDDRKCCDTCGMSCVVPSKLSVYEMSLFYLFCVYGSVFLHIASHNLSIKS